MKNLPSELVYVLIFAAVLLLQYLMKRFAPKAPQDAAPAARLPEFADEPEETFTPPPVSRVPVGHFGRGEMQSAPPATPGRRFSRQSLMGNKRELQNAIVIATVLGPCRAFEPHDIR